jgi:hypothetical protein
MNCSRNATYHNMHHAARWVIDNPESHLRFRSTVRAPGPLCAEAGTRAAAPFPAPLSPLAASFLRWASDRFLLTKPNTSCTIGDASVATLRWCSGSSRNAVRIHSGFSVRLRRNPPGVSVGCPRCPHRSHRPRPTLHQQRTDWHGPGAHTANQQRSLSCATASPHPQTANRTRFSGNPARNLVFRISPS